MIVAIDGPAGAGKSTVCKATAERLGFVYLDTGAMYRAVAWALEKAFGRETEPGGEGLKEMLDSLDLRFAMENERLAIFFGQKRLAGELRTPEATEAASRVSRRPEVREFLVACQRKLAREAPGVVAEGRDTATVVFPDAELKVFLTADLKTRAKRRFAEYAEKGGNISLEEIERLIGERDEADSGRDHSPLRMAEGAVFLDTSGLSVEGVVDRLCEMVRNPVEKHS